MKILETEDRTFIVKAQFKLEGDLPTRLKPEQLQEYIEDAINTHCNVAIHGERFGDYDEEFEAFVKEGGCTIELEEYKVTYSSTPFCEHCGENWTDFAAEISNGTSHCITCAESMDMFTKDEVKEIEKKEKRLKKKYYERKLKELK